MSLESVSFVASGNVTPCRFVYGISGTDFTVGAITATTQRPVGVAWWGTQEPPGTSGDSGYLATTGKLLRVAGPGEQCLVQIGAGGCSAFDYLVPDASGLGVIASLTISSHQDIGAMALRNGAAGDRVPAVVCWISGRQGNSAT